MSLAANAARMIARKGETMTLSREGEAAAITVIGKRAASGSTESVGGTAVQQIFTVRIRPTELDASAWAVKVPRRHDVLTVGGRGREVKDATPISDGDTVAMYELEVAG